MNPIKDPIKNTLVPLQTNFNTNGSVRWRTFVFGQWGKIPVIVMGFADTFQLRLLKDTIRTSVLHVWLSFGFHAFGSVAIISSLPLCFCLKTGWLNIQLSLT